MGWGDRGAAGSQPGCLCQGLHWALWLREEATGQPPPRLEEPTTWHLRTSPESCGHKKWSEVGTKGKADGTTPESLSLQRPLSWAEDGVVRGGLTASFSEFQEQSSEKKNLSQAPHCHWQSSYGP